MLEDLIGMFQAKAQEEKSGPPAPMTVFLSSLFLYPGVGHFMLGKKKQGVILATVFTLLTLGIVVEVALIAGPLLKLMTQMEPMEHPPNLVRILFWIVSTTVVWLGGGWHCYSAAQRLRGEAVSSEP